MAVPKSSHPSSLERRIEDAVFELMASTDIPDIRVSEVVQLSGVSKATFYRHFRNVDDVVKRFEDRILTSMESINRVALQTSFRRGELEPSSSMIERMGVLLSYREKLIALNGIHGDPQFQHKASVFMHEYFRDRISNVSMEPDAWDLYLSFVVAGHNNLIVYWLEKRPDLDVRFVATALCRFFYGPFFLDKKVAPEFPRGIDFS